MTENTRILVVEDTDEDFNVYRAFLEEEGGIFIFLHARTGAEALKYLETIAFDCILLDYQLPDVDGLTLIESMRKMNVPLGPVVMITGRGDERLAVRAMHLGAADYVVKSDLSPENLTRAVGNAIARSRDARRVAELQTREAELTRQIGRERGQFLSFLEHLPTPVAVLRASDQSLEFTNRPMRELLGADQRLSTILGAEIEELAAAVFRAERRHEVDDLEIGQRYYRLTLEPYQTADEAFVLLALNDVTRSVEARQILEESERRFKRIAEELPQMLWIADRAGQAEYMNAAFRRFSGTDGETRTDWTEEIHPQDRGRVLELWTNSVETETEFEASFRLRRAADGAYRWVVSRGVPLRDAAGALLRWYGSHADVHDMRVLTESLRDSEQRLTAATETSGVGVWEVDLATNEIWCNPEFDRAFGYVNHGGAWSVGKILSHVSEAHRARFDDAVRRSLKDRVDFAQEFEVRGADDVTRWLLARSAVTQAADGRWKMVGTVIDISDRIAREQELKAARLSAERASASKSSFMANMSHEIRTPLGAIMGFSELIAGDGLGPARRAEYAATVQRNGRVLMQIIDDILDLSKIEAGKLSVIIEESDLRVLFEDLANLFETHARRKGLRLEFEFDEALPRRVRTDPVRLRQILFNLIGNALKFTETGGVTVSAHARGGQIVFAVTDTGIGISEEQGSRLFQAFTQGDESTNRRFGGTGLGLSLSRRFASLLGGALELRHSARGEGATFELSLPLEVAPARDDLPPPRPRERALARARLLVVDDSDDSRFLTRNYLERAGAEVEDYGSAAEGLRRLESGNFDAVLTDIQMPDMDGFQFTAELRRRGYAKPILGLTAHVFAEDRARVLESGLDAHVSKPLNVRALIDAVSAQLTRH